MRFFLALIAAVLLCFQPGMAQTPILSVRWLIPRLERFHTERPEVEIAVTTTTTLHEALRGGFDVAVRHGSAERTAWPQHRPVHFLDEADTLVMSPALFDQRPVRKPEDLLGHTLLASETRPGDWTDWLDHAGLSHMAGQRRRIFDHFFVTLQAVVDGLGVGIGPLPVLASDMAAGRLVAPFSDILVPRIRLRSADPLRCRQDLVTRRLRGLACRRGQCLYTPV